MPFEEKEISELGKLKTDFYQRSLKNSAEFRQRYAQQKTIVKAAEMPWEDSPQGLIKHLVNEEMDTKEYCLDIYQQFLKQGEHSGKHRHLTEEILYILEGKGYDLHWDVKFDCADAYIWDWESEPQKFSWQEGDFVYIPPYAIHQHSNSNSDKPARLISCTSRIVKALGFDWFDQLEDAPSFKKGSV